MESRAFLVVLALAAVDATAGDIYKCVDGGGTTYQSMPCARAQDEVPSRLAGASSRRPVEAAVPETYASTPGRKRGPWTHATIEIGVSDDEVLNMPGWGRPARISRARVARGWEEVWRYGNGYSSGRELRFVNARLADIGESPPALASAR